MLIVAPPPPAQQHEGEDSECNEGEVLKDVGMVLAREVIC